MKTKISTKWHRLLLGAIPALLLGSCSADKDLGSDLRTSDQTMVTFSIQLPAAAAPSPASRALDETTDENDVSEIDILVFDQNGGNFVYNTRCNGSDIKGITGDNRTKTFTVTLRQGDYDLVLLANSHQEVNTALGGFTGNNKADVLAMLEAQMPGGGKWIADARASAYRPFPMWGDVGNVTINDQTNLTGDNAIKLTRMVARVDVAVTVNNFKLTSVDVYNYNTKGAIVPTAVGAWDNVTRGPIRYDNKDGKTEIDETNNRCYTEIYLFEAENHTDANHTTAKNLTDRTCLVIGGVWDADGGNNFSGEPTYYRVDFSEGTGTQQTFLDVLRNHKYIFSITEVSGPGCEDSKTAFESGPVNIEASVLQWDDAEMTEIVFDGQNYLSVSQSEFNFTREARTSGDTDNKLTVRTDVPAGWKATVWNDLAGTEGVAKDGTTNSAWLSISPTFGDGDGTSDVITLETSANNSGVERTAYIHITAGRLNYIVKVVQSSAQALGIQLTDWEGKPVTELVFTNDDVNTSPQTLNVNWQPADATLTITNTKIGTAAFVGTGIPGGTDDTNNGAGSRTYSIAPTTAFDPDDSDPFAERVSKIDFTITSGIDYASKSVFLRHVNYAAVPVGSPSCLLDGGRYSFGIRSNTEWKIASIKQWSSSDTTEPTAQFLASPQSSGDNLRVEQTGGYNVSPDGEKITFTVIKNEPRELTGTIEVEFTSPTNLFANFTVTIEVLNDPWARSNIVWVDNSSLSLKGILTFAVTPDDNTNSGREMLIEGKEVTVRAIPANSQGVFFKWGSLVAISPAMLYVNNTTYSYKYKTGYYYNTGILDGQGHVLYSPVTVAFDYTWAAIPHCLSGYYDGIWGNAERDEDDFKGFGPDRKGFDKDAGLGDICRYISAQGWVKGNWRLPTAAEIEELVRAGQKLEGEWKGEEAVAIGGSNAITSHRGVYSILSGFWLGEGSENNKNDPYYDTDMENPKHGSIFVPASGYRVAEGNNLGTATNAGTNGYFWSGSSSTYSSEVRAFRLSMNSGEGLGGGATLNSSAFRGDALPVRCIRDTGK